MSVAQTAKRRRKQMRLDKRFSKPKATKDAPPKLAAKAKKK